MNFDDNVFTATAGVPLEDMDEIIPCITTDVSGLVTVKNAQSANLAGVAPTTDHVGCYREYRMPHINENNKTCSGEEIQNVLNVRQPVKASQTTDLDSADGKDSVEKETLHTQMSTEFPQGKRSSTSSLVLAKDQKYRERRRRNNLAAKRSRDAKKLREAAIIEHWKFLQKRNIELKEKIQSHLQDR